MSRLTSLLAAAALAVTPFVAVSSATAAAPPTAAASDSEHPPLVAYGSQNRVMLTYLEGGDATDSWPLITFSKGSYFSNVAISGDGTRVLYSGYSQRHGKMLEEVRETKTGKLVWSRTTESPTHTDISPDGSKLLVRKHEGDGVWSDHVVNIADGRSTRLNLREDQSAGAFTSDGTGVVINDNDNETVGIFTIATGKTRTVVPASSDPAVEYTQLTASPDGTIAYGVFRGCGQPYSFRTVQEDGTGGAQLATDGSRHQLPAFSPDGDRVLAYTHEKPQVGTCMGAAGEHFPVAVLDRNGANRTDLFEMSDFDWGANPWLTK